MANDIPTAWLGEIVFFQYAPAKFIPGIVVAQDGDVLELQLFTSTDSDKYGYDGGTTLRTNVKRGNNVGEWTV